MAILELLASRTLLMDTVHEWRRHTGWTIFPYSS